MSRNASLQRRIFTTALAVLAMLVLASATATAVEPRPSVGDKIYDVTVLRPFGLVRTVLGVPFLVVAYPFSLAADSDEVVDRTVKDPFEDTFQRKLGDI